MLKKLDLLSLLRWCCARDLFGSLIPVTRGGLNCKSHACKVVTKPTRLNPPVVTEILKLGLKLKYLNLYAYFVQK